MNVVLLVGKANCKPKFPMLKVPLLAPPDVVEAVTNPVTVLLVPVFIKRPFAVSAVMALPGAMVSMLPFKSRLPLVKVRAAEAALRVKAEPNFTAEEVLVRFMVSVERFWLPDAKAMGSMVPAPPIVITCVVAPVKVPVPFKVRLPLMVSPPPTEWFRVMVLPAAIFRVMLGSNTKAVVLLAVRLQLPVTLKVAALPDVILPVEVDWNVLGLAPVMVNVLPLRSKLPVFESINPSILAEPMLVRALCSCTFEVPFTCMPAKVSPPDLVMVWVTPVPKN